MVAKVSSINAFRTWTNSSGMIEDEELSFREWNGFKHDLARQREESRLSVPSGNGPATGADWSGKKTAHLYTAQAWSSAFQAWK
jgi:hypothetical protein